MHESSKNPLTAFRPPTASCPIPGCCLASRSSPVHCRRHHYHGGGAGSISDLGWGGSILENVMEALADPNTHLIGVYGSNDDIKDELLQTVNRRIQRDALFDRVLTATITRKPYMKKIQEEIARPLGLIFNHESEGERAQELIERIKTEQKNSNCAS